MKTLRIMLMLSLAALVAGACGEEPDIYNPLTPGQTDFTNTEPGSSYGRGGEYDSSNKGGAGTGAPQGSNPSTPPPGAPPSGREGTVEEADIYKVDKDRLFYLNTYRGFIIYDMKNPKDPKLISRLPVYGYPIEMFIKDNTVYALIKDALYLTQEKGKLKFKRHNVSQLVAIDISNLKQPKVLQTVDITGQLREGVSRKIEDTIYVVSYIPRYYYSGWNYYYNKNKAKEQAWVYSFNVKDPKNLQVVQKLKVFEGGGYSSYTGGTSERRYFNKITISATSNMLMVVENWRKYGYVSGGYKCGSYTSMQEAVVSLIDISDPKGKIALYTKFETYGELGDQFKQTYIFDKKKKTGTYLGIFARREWNSQNCTGGSFIQNNLEAWDITNPAQPTRLDRLSFGKKNETVRGSVFDSDRSTAFAITARQIDPLYAISFADPKDLQITSMVDNLSGDMSVFRFINNKKFLIGIGRDTTKACDGFADNGSGWSSGIAVSIIDVQKLDDIRLVQRQCVAVKNASWVSSQLSWNLDQAHKMIGMHSDGSQNVITVPVYYYTKNKDGSWWYYNYQTAVGMMSWDLSKYDKTKAVPQTGVLTNYGTIIHPKGQVRRSVVFSHKASGGRRKVVNLSDTHVSLVDIEDLKKPVTDAVVEVAPYHRQVFRFGDYMVEQIEQGGTGRYYYGSSYGGATEFRVKKIGSGKLEDATEVGGFLAAQVERVVKHKNNLVIFRRVYNEAGKSKPGYYPYGYYRVSALVYDMSNPTKPTKRGSVELPMSYMPYYYYWCGTGGYWGGWWFDRYWNYYSYGNSWTTTDDGMAFLTQQYDYQHKGYTKKLVFLNLSNPDKPTYKELKLTTNNDWHFFNLVTRNGDASKLYLSYRIKVGEMQYNGSKMYLYKYYAQRWDLQGGKWNKGPAINLPGRLIKAWQKGAETRFLTYDYTYKKVYSKSGNGYYSWQPAYRLNMLRRITVWGQPLAELLDFRGFNNHYLNDLVMDGQKLYVNAGAGYSYTPSGDWTKDSDRLFIFDVGGYAMKEAYNQPTGTYNVRLMGTYQGKLFVNLPSDGVLVVDTSIPSQPDGQQFMRTLGYATHIEFAKGTAYIAAGNFGIYQLDLLGKKAIPSS